MAISEQYFHDFEKNYNIIVYHLLKEKLFISFGLELTATKVRFCSNSNFALAGQTFAYYNPIDDSLNINIEDPFFTRCTSEKQRMAKLIFILFHEAYHKTLMHTERKNGKDHSLWNIACDYEVHNMLYLYANISKNDKNNSLKVYFELIDEMLKTWDNPKYKADPKNGEYGLLFSTKLLENIAEEIYQMIINSKKTEETTYTMSLSQMSGGNNSQSDSMSSGSSSDSDDNNEESDSSDGDGEGKSNSDKDSSDESDSNSNNGSGKNNKENKKNKDQNDGYDNKGNKSKQTQSNATSSGNSGNNSGPTVKVTKTTYTLPDGRQHTVVDIEWPDISTKSKEQQKEDKNNKELRKQLMEQEIKNAYERNKGNISTKCEMFLKKLFKIKIDWEKILKASLQTILSKSDYFTWARPRTSMFAMDMYLPAVCEDSQEYGTLIVARDESGSMSDEEVAKAGAIIADAKEHYKKIVILKHDTEIQYEGEFENIDNDVIKMLCTRATCGGTSHKEVFEYIANYNKKHAFEDEAISCVILLTDCCSDIVETQKIVPNTIPMVYLVPDKALEYTKGIRGKIIPIEL